jgi:glycosyltransferase involved in cell wall biosynthesis
MGHDVHFLFVQVAEGCDVPKMQAFWGDSLYHVRARYPRRGLSRFLVRAMKQIPGMHLYFLDNWYYRIDDWYHRSLDPCVARLANEIKPDVVLVEYVFLSRAFLHFEGRVLKVIDTHDVFTHRHRAFQNFLKYKPYRWWTATPTGEALGLSRADVIIAIQEQDAKYFRQLSGQRVVTVGHLLPPCQRNPKGSIGRDLLFVGTASTENRLGIQFFLRDVLPRIRRLYPDARLLLVGKICHVIDDAPACIKLGIVDDLAGAYERSAIVINPTFAGTGLAIKSIEALSYGKPLVTTTWGARGFDGGVDSAFYVVDDAAGFTQAIVQLFGDSERRRTVATKGYEFARRYHRVNLERLAMVVQNEEAHHV